MSARGCHMPDATGATGAGTYPSLAAGKNLEIRQLSGLPRHQRPPRHAATSAT